VHAFSRQRQSFYVSQRPRMLMTPYTPKVTRMFSQQPAWRTCIDGVSRQACLQLLCHGPNASSRQAVLPSSKHAHHKLKQPADSRGQGFECWGLSRSRQATAVAASSRQAVLPSSKHAHYKLKQPADSRGQGFECWGLSRSRQATAVAASSRQAVLPSSKHAHHKLKQPADSDAQGWQIRARPQ
jgi:hypothetical protein